MQNTVLFAFKGNPICFVHVLLNGLDIAEKGGTCRIVLEGEAVTLVKDLEDPGQPLHGLWRKARGQGLVDGACRACAVKLGALEAVEAAALPLLDDMAGHAGMARYLAEGWQVITL